jgi:hypothetical protein
MEFHLARFTPPIESIESIALNSVHVVLNMASTCPPSHAGGKTHARADMQAASPAAQRLRDDTLRPRRYAHVDGGKGHPGIVISKARKSHYREAIYAAV